MALDATVAGASADSYLTVAEADALAAADLGPESDLWQAAGTTAARKEAALRRATRELDDLVRPGSRHSPAQALAFPRAVDVDADGQPFVPRDVRHATYYQAAFVLANAAVLDRANQRSARNASRASEQNTSYDQAADGRSLYSLRAQQALAAYATADREGGGFVAVSATAGVGDPYASEAVL